MFNCQKYVFEINICRFFIHTYKSFSLLFVAQLKFIVPQTRIAITVNQSYGSVLIIDIFKLGFPNECAAVGGDLCMCVPIGWPGQLSRRCRHNLRSKLRTRSTTNDYLSIVGRRFRALSFSFPSRPVPPCGFIYTQSVKDPDRRVKLLSRSPLAG